MKWQYQNGANQWRSTGSAKMKKYGVAKSEKCRRRGVMGGEISYESIGVTAAA